MRVTIAFTCDVVLRNKIFAVAAADERSASQWLRAHFRDFFVLPDTTDVKSAHVAVVKDKTKLNATTDKINPAVEYEDYLVQDECGEWVEKVKSVVNVKQSDMPKIRHDTNPKVIARWDDE